MIKKFFTYLLTGSILASTVLSPLQTYASDFEPESKIELNESSEELLNEEKEEIDNTEDLDDEEIVEDIDVSENDENEIIPDDFSEEKVEVIDFSDEEEIVKEEIIVEEQYLEKEFDGKTISVNGNLPVGTEIKVSYVNTEEIAENLEEGEVLAFAYDISLWFNDEEIKPDDTVTVSISGIEEELENMGIDIEDVETLKITHIADNGTEEIVFEENEVIDDISFETDSFSVYTATVYPGRTQTLVNTAINVVAAISGEKFASERQVVEVVLSLRYSLPQLQAIFGKDNVKFSFNNFDSINPVSSFHSNEKITVYTPYATGLQSPVDITTTNATLSNVYVISALTPYGKQLTAKEFEKLYTIKFTSGATDFITLVPVNRTIATYNDQEYKLNDSSIHLPAGNNVTGYWFSDEGLLIFSGSGEMTLNTEEQRFVAQGNSETVALDKNFITDVCIDPRVTSIPDNFLANCPNLESVSCDFGNIKTIGASAFENCSNLSFADEEIPASVQSIGANAFTGSNIVFKRNASAVEITEEMGVQTTFTVIDQDEDGNELGREEFIGTVGSDVTTDVATAEYEGYSLAQVNTRSLAVTGLNDDEGINVIVPQNSGTVTIGASDSDRLELVRTFALTPDSEKVFEYNGKEYFDTEATATYTAGDNITAYWYESDGVLGLIGSGDMYDLEYSTIPWVSIKSNITDVYLSDGITTIGTNVFRDCIHLTDVLLPSSLETIGDYAFQTCTNLALIELPSGLTTIGNSAFSGCVKLKAINALPSCLTTIGNSAFNCCSNLALTGELPSGLTSIGGGAFSGCFDLALTGELPASLTTIGDSVFSDCENLALTGSLPSGLTSIGTNAFRECTNLALTGSIPESVSHIGGGAFYYCENLALTGDLPSSLINVGDNIFYECDPMMTHFDRNLSDVEIGIKMSIPTSYVIVDEDEDGNELNSVVAYGFVGTKTVIPEAPEYESYTLVANATPEPITIGKTASERTRAVRTYSKNLHYLTTYKNKDYYDLDATNTWSLQNGFTAYWYESDGFLYFDGIGEMPAFGMESRPWHGLNVTDIKFSDDVTYIGSQLAHGFTTLTDVVLPASLKKIGLGAFAGCTNLENMTELNEGLEEIGYFAFLNCKKLELTQELPSTLKIIRQEAFSHSGVAFTGSLPSGLEDIGFVAFEGCTNLNLSGDIPESVTNIGGGAFNGCLNSCFERNLSDYEITDFHTVPTRFTIVDLDDADGKELGRKDYIGYVGYEYKATVSDTEYEHYTLSDAKDKGNLAIDKVGTHTILHRYWTADTYTIKFVDALDGTTISNKTYTYSSTVDIPTAPVHTGYTFTTWSPAVAKVSEDATYKAIYSHNSYVVKFKDYDGELISLKVYNSGDRISIPDDPTRDGYIFDGWSPEVSKTADADATYKATYTKKEPVVTPETIKPDVSPITPTPTPVAPVPEVKEETNPKTPVEEEVEEDVEDDEPEEIKVIIPDKSDNPEPKTIEIPKKTYKITFVDDEGNVISAKYYKEGDAVSIPDAPEKENYEFTNWSPAFSTKAVADAEYKPIYKEVKKEEPVAPAPKEPVEKPKTPIQKAVPAIVAGVVTTGILATGYFSGLWLFLANLLFVKRRKKWHGLLNLEENGFVKNILDESEDDVYIEDVWAKSNGNVDDFIENMKSLKTATLLPVGTRMFIYLGDGVEVVEYKDADEKKFFDALKDNLDAFGKVTLELRHDKFSVDIEVTFEAPVR